MTFRISGATASLAPNKQNWIFDVIGENIDGETIYAAYKQVVLEFDSCEASLFQQWSNAVTGGSIESITMLNPDAITYSAFSTVKLVWEKRPTLQSGIMDGPWSIRIRDVKYP